MYQIFVGENRWGVWFMRFCFEGGGVPHRQKKQHFWGIIITLIPDYETNSCNKFSMFQNFKIVHDYAFWLIKIVIDTKIIFQYLQ